MEPQATTSNAPTPKTPVPRGARACMVCRQAKMKCVVPEDGSQRCQRCIRAGVDCVFEKHRRGRKPGSKLSEASKMLRRLEKGLNNAKAKQPTNPALSQASSASAQFGQDDAAGPSNFPGSATHAAQQYDEDMDDDEEDRPEEALYPEKVIRNSHKSSFLDIVMNPEPAAAAAAAAAEHARPRSGASTERAHSLPHATSQSPTRSHSSPQPKPYSSIFAGYVPKDPVAAGIIHESEVDHFFDMFFLRLNPFINLFDPSLHSSEYVRSRSPFLFTAMLMACCKFFKSRHYHAVRRLAEEWSVFTFAEGTESVETVQALACMTYWKEPTDRRTWSYIGMACRMAVNLRLNKYVGRRQPQETTLNFLERRNRERTYLVLFVHDRSLSMQTGKHWMLHEDELVRNSRTWHEDGCSGARGEIRPEDIIVAAFVQLRLIGSEATDTFYNRASGLSSSFPSGMSFEHELRKSNSKLDIWSQTWDKQLSQCSQAGTFHYAFIQFFQSHVRLFLNTFGLNLSSHERVPANPEAVEQCYRSARTNLQIISQFDQLHVLPYCQESITVMTAYAAIVLLRLLRGPSTMSQLADSAAEEIHGVISGAADAYQHASHITGSEIDCAAYHARFLRRLVATDVERARQQVDRNGFRQEGIPPLFAQALPPLRNAQPAGVQHIPQPDFYSLPRPAPSHAHQSAPLPPLSMIGPSAQHTGFVGHTNEMDGSVRNGLPPNNGRVPLAYPSAQSASEADDSYWHYMLNEVSEFPKGDGSPASGGLVGNPPMADFSYPSSSQYREPQYPPMYGGHLQGQGRPASHPYLPPVQSSFGHPSFEQSR
ncbi:hypothetical protein OH77DRAFT_1492105 [Trametes cingulata]|nr:hypothetical protein OH77DRAFT_1492105 [Trametes cingulata]